MSFHLAYSRIFIVKYRPLIWLYREKLKRHFYLKLLWRRLILSYLLNMAILPTYKKAYIKYLISITAKFGSQTLQNNRCIMSGRAHGIVSKTLLSRYHIRTYKNIGMLISTQQFCK